MSDVHVAVAVIKNTSNEVLISLRPDDVHQGGFWEFPGGKVEEGESVLDALKREIFEELGIEVVGAQAYKTIRHNYSDKTVILDVWQVDEFIGEPRGVEGQLVKWQRVSQLKVEDFPAANRSIVLSLLLPDKYMITGSFKTQDEFANRLENSLKKGISIVQLRCKNCSDDEYLSLAVMAQLLCESYQAILLLNTTLDVFNQTRAQGLHLSGQRLHEFKSRPVGDTNILSASCHTHDDIEKAKKLNADIILLSPVKETKSHPGVEGIGWEKFEKMISSNEIPAYALGGMTSDDIVQARSAGAQGIAAISNLWLES